MLRLLFVAFAGLAFVGVLIAISAKEDAENQKWNDFKRKHKCREEMSLSGNFWEGAKMGYRCDDDKIYWRRIR